MYELMSNLNPGTVIAAEYLIILGYLNKKIIIKKNVFRFLSQRTSINSYDFNPWHSKCYLGLDNSEVL